MKTSVNVGASIAVGVAVCVITALVSISALAWLIANAYISGNSSLYVCVGVLIVSTIAGTFTAILKAKEKPLWISLITAFLFWIILLLCNALLFEGMYDGIVVTSLCITGSAICTALLNTQKNGKRKRYGKRR